MAAAAGEKERESAEVADDKVGKADDNYASSSFFQTRGELYEPVHCKVTFQTN